MEQELETCFDQVVRGAADRAHQFLDHIQTLCVTSGLPMDLQPHKRLFGKRTVLRGRLQVGKFMRKTRPMQLEVFADRVGATDHLQVGWQVTKEVAGSFATTFTSVAIAEGIRDRRDSSADSQREINAILDIFQNDVFGEAFNALVEDVERDGPGGSSGFLGA